jgi:signal transduction histidine kinase/HAMP domain-containing protein
MSTANEPLDNLKGFGSSFWGLIRSIRARIILPYVILTVLVAFVGTYIVTTLVQDSLEERLQSQLADASGVASDEVALFEAKLLSQLRELTFLSGAYEAMRDGDIGTLESLLVPSISNSDIRRAFIVDADGNVVSDISLSPGSAEPQTGGSLTGRNLALDVPLLQHVLSGVSDEYGDRQAGLVEIDGELFLAISGPFRWSDDPSDEGGASLGAVVVAEPLQSLIDQIKETAVARRVTVYGPDGRVVATTLGADQPRLEQLAITPAFFQYVISNPESTYQEERDVLGRRVRFAFFPFLIRHQALGAMSVGIESGFVPEKGGLGRLQLTAVFSLATLAVIGIGVLVSRRIIVPIMKLVTTSRAVAQGDLTQRTGIRSNDEIGALAETFDDMTEKLNLRTTELERLLREQREEASRVQAILSSIAEGVLLEDQSSRISVMNPAAENLLALLSEQFTAMKPVREIDAATDARRFEIGESVISVETSPVLMSDGQQLGKVLVLRDITRETEADRLKDEFIAQISHELRTPLTSIKGYSDLLLRAMGGPVSEQQRVSLEIINRHADTLEDMIADLLDFTQLEAGNLGLRFGPMSMETLVQQVAERWQEDFDDKGIDFTVDIQGPIPSILGDEARLRRALDNLVENACNYTLEGGQASILLKADEHSVTVAIKDTGVGIAPEDQAHLFNRFYRVGLERTVDVRGVGVDLYVTKAIVEGHGGEITVESALHEGSTFTVTLPLDAGAREKPASQTISDLGDLLR